MKAYEKTDEKSQQLEAQAEHIRQDIKHERSHIRAFIHDLFDIKDNMMSYEEIDIMMQEHTVIHGPNMWILMLAILIASIGLNVNSTAVIIGAMLISPLMSGIMTMGYSLAVRDLIMLKRAFTRFATQVVICLITSTVYFLISPLSEPTSEIIARTNPTIWDVLIALFGGIAGMIGHTRKKQSNVIPGVAIATALMPPLCTAGYGIATMQLSFFAGAFYLFIINTLFIALSTAFVTLVLRVPYHKNISRTAQKRINAIVFAISAIAVVPSVYVGMYTVYDSVLDNNISKYLNEEFSFSDTQAVKTTVDKQNKIISVSLVGTPVSADVVSMLQNQLPSYNLGDYRLQITQNEIQQGVTQEQLSELLGESEEKTGDKVKIIIQEQTISELTSEIEEKDTIISQLSSEIDGYRKSEQEAIDFQSLAGDAEQIYPHLNNVHIGVISGSSGDCVVLTADSNEEIGEYERMSAERWLKNQTGYTQAYMYISQPSEEADLSESDDEEEPEQKNTDR